MTETLFEIVSLEKPLYPKNNASASTYNSLLQYFCSNSYGLYTEQFIKKIAADSQNSHHHLHKFHLKKSLRKCVKKFMMTDLQLVFLAYYCSVNEWKIQTKGLLTYLKIQQTQTSQELQQKSFQMFLDLNSYFVKSYIGNDNEFEVIKQKIGQQYENFESIYQKWVLSQSKQIFIVTPKKINQLYRHYSQYCQVQSNKKDYNDFVDTLIDLSTSYSIMPNKKNEVKQKQTNKNHVQINEKSKLNEQHKIKRKKSQGIFKIHQNQQNMEDSPVPQQNFQVFRKPKRKSSLLFQSLQSLSRKSEQLITQNKRKQQKQQNNNQIQLERSREKKPINKISLSFKRKQKPNEIVLGYIKQPSVLQIMPDTQVKKDNRSLLNQSVIQNNFSFINLRSNRSSKNNSQLPFPWRPSEDSFFDKSKLN